jgi:hypothetical protein
MTKAPGVIQTPKQMTRAEREARQGISAARRRTADKEYEVAQKALPQNRDRLKAERLARERGFAAHKIKP